MHWMLYWIQMRNKMLVEKMQDHFIFSLVLKFIPPFSCSQISFIIYRNYSLELLSLARAALALLRSRYPVYKGAFYIFLELLVFIVTTFIFSFIFFFVHLFYIDSSLISQSIDGLGLFRFGFAKETVCSIGQSQTPENSSSSLRLTIGELILLVLRITDIPEIESPQLTTDWESESKNLDSSAMKATLSQLREFSEPKSSSLSGAWVYFQFLIQEREAVCPLLFF